MAEIEKVIKYTLHNVDINQLWLIYKALRDVKIATVKESENRDMILKEIIKELDDGRETDLSIIGSNNGSSNRNDII